MHLIVETKDIFSKRQDVRVINKDTGAIISAKNLTITFDADDWFSFTLDGQTYVLDGSHNSIEFVETIEDYLAKKLAEEGLKLTDISLPEPENIELPTPPVNRIHLKKGLEKMEDFKGFYEGGPITIIMYIHEDEVRVDKLGFPAEDAKLSSIFLCTQHTGYVEVMSTKRPQ